MDNCGIYIREANGKYTIAYNGVEQGITIDPINQFGVIAVDNTLEIYGNKISKSGSSSTLRESGSDVSFGDALLATTGTCINITKENYNKLLRGEIVNGYSKYKRNAVYNIVSDVSESPTITYSVKGNLVRFSTSTLIEKSENMIYANSGVLTDNVEDTNATIDNTDSPFIGIKWFNPIVNINGTIDITYNVDTMDMAALNYDSQDRTFTVIIETESGDVVKKTTYAGIHQITTPAFKDSGETWLSIKCVDSRGVSCAEQYHDILVRIPMVYNTYIMKDSDLEEFTYDGNTYKIVPDDNTVSIALANKAALSAFFAKLKNDGYNRVVMLNKVYWIDYHKKSMASMTGGDDLVFPDEFTVDLNGATICATQCNDLKSGHVIYFYKNYDTHIVNGKLKGNYEGFDFAETKKNTTVGSENVVPGETLSVIGCAASSFCSFENLDISNSVGYDGSFGSIYAKTTSHPSYEVGCVDMINGNVDNGKTGMVVSDLITIKDEWLSLGEVAMCKFGYGGYWIWDKREYFMSFYDQSDNYISTVKTKMYFGVKIPKSAKKLRVSGYGTPDEWDYSSSGAIVAIHERSKNILVSNCDWHDTRSCCISPTHVKGLKFENCRFWAIAKETGLYSVTRLFADIEDGWQWACDICFSGCVMQSPISETDIKVMYCTNFTFENNSGIRLWAEGGLESGFVCDNTMPTVQIDRTYRSQHPNVYYKNNTITTLTVNDVLPVVEPLTMVNTIIKNKCSFSKLHLKNSENGGNYFY